MSLIQCEINYSVLSTEILLKEASEEIWEICNQLYGKQIDLSSWKRKISGDEDTNTKIVHEAYDHTKDAAGDAIVDG